VLSSEPRVSVIVLGYNGRGYVDECLRSVLDQDFGEPYEVLFVDNDSTDGSADAAVRYEDVRVVRLPRNLGYCGGNNAGFELAMAPLVVFLNQDTVVHRAWLRELVAAVESDDAIMAAHANVIHPWNAEYLARERLGRVHAVYAPDLSRLGFVEYRRIDSSGRGAGGSPGQDHRWTEPSSPLRETLVASREGARVVDTLSLSGVSLIVRRAVVEEAGGYVFDPDMFAYGEDVDLALRIRGLGYRTVLAAGAVVYHDHTLEDSPSPKSFVKAVRIVRNRLLAFWKNSDGWEFAALATIMLVGSPFNATAFGMPAWRKAVNFVLLTPPTFVAALAAMLAAPRYAGRRRQALRARRMPRGWLIRSLLSKQPVAFKPPATARL
jgi:GT2 family glycosyltransferase